MSEVTIDKIAIEVDSSAAITTQGIDELSAALSKLRSSAKLTATSNNLRKLAESIRELKNVSASASGLRSITNAINGLAGVKDMKNFQKAVNSISKLPKAVAGIEKTNLGIVNMQLSALSQAVKPLESIGKSNLGTTLNQLKKFPEVAKNLKSSDIGEFALRIKELTVALEPLSVQMEKIAAGFNVLPRNINKALKTLDTYNSTTGKASKANGIFSGTLGGVRTSWLAYGYAIRTVLDLATDAFVAFTERYETMNLFSVAMGEYTDEAYEYAMKVQNALGINAAEWAKNQGTFMMLITGFGEARDTAYEMSKGLTQFAYDLSSIANMPLEEAFTKVQAGIAGEIEPLRRVGIDLSEARLQEIAYANGINQKVSAMNQASKAELRYIAITQQIPGVVGDMSRTLTSPANGLRVLRSQFGLLAQTIGSLINVVVGQFIPIMMAITKAIISVANALSALITGKSLADWDKESFSMSSNLGSAAGSAGDVADETGTAAGNLKDAADNAKKAKQYMMGWDELNVIDTTSAAAAGSGGGGGGAGGGIAGGGLGLDLDSLWTEDMLKGINQQTDELVAKIRALLPIVATIGTMFAAWKIGTALFSEFQKLKSAAEGLSAALARMGIATSISPWKLLAGAVMGAAGAFLYIKGIFDSILNGISWTSLLENLAGVALGFAALDLVFKNSPIGTYAKALLLVVSGVGMLAVAIGEILNGEATPATFASSLAGVALAAGGVALAFGPIPGLIAAAVGIMAVAGATIYAHWSEIKAFFEDLWDTVVEKVNAAAEAVRDKFATAVETAHAIIGTAVEGIRGFFEDTIPNAIDVAVEWFENLPYNIGYAVGSAYTEISAWGTSVYEYFSTEIPEIVRAVAGWFADLPGKAYDAIKGFINDVATWAKDTYDTFNTKVDEIIKAVAGWFAALPGKIYNAIKDMASHIQQWREDVKGFFETEVSNILDAVAGWFADLPGKIYAKIVECYEDIKKIGKYILDGIFDGFSNLGQKVSNWAGKFVQGFKDALKIASPSKVMQDEVGYYIGSGIASGIDDSVGDVTTSASSLATTMLTAFQSMFAMSSSEDDQGEFLTYGDTMMLSLRDGLQNSAPKVYSTLQQIADTIRKIMDDLVTATQMQARQIISAAQAAREAASSIDVSSSKVSSVRMRASGGTVPSGELFMARESGPELVGSIGNTTTVMNNDQIVSAVSSGVARAVAAVMGGQSGGEQKVEVYLDGEKIYANQKKIARSKGREFNMGAFAR